MPRAPAPCTWSARPRARCCKGEIPVQFHLPELNSPMRTEEKVGFVPPFVPPLGPGYPPFCPMLEVSRKFFRHIPSAPRAAAQQHLSRCTSTTAAPGRQCLSRCTCTARPAPAPCTWSAPWQASASASAPQHHAPGGHQALTQQQAQQHALELRHEASRLNVLYFPFSETTPLSLVWVFLSVLFGFFGLLQREIQCPIEESNRVFLPSTPRLCSVIRYGAARHIDVPSAQR